MSVGMLTGDGLNSQLDDALSPSRCMLRSDSRGRFHAFRADIEGLRGVAVLAVVFYHARVGWFRGGYVGVDVFFVISGFLITQLLVRELRSTGRIAFGGFYGRRVRRLLPAATLVVVVTLAVSSRILSPL